MTTTPASKTEVLQSTGGVKNPPPLHVAGPILVEGARRAPSKSIVGDQVQRINELSLIGPAQKLDCRSRGSFTDGLAQGPGGRSPHCPPSNKTGFQIRSLLDRYNIDSKLKTQHREEPLQNGRLQLELCRARLGRGRRRGRNLAATQHTTKQPRRRRWRRLVDLDRNFRRTLVGTTA